MSVTQPHSVISLPTTALLLGEGNGTPLQYSCLESPTEEPGRLRSMRSLKSQTRLRNLTFTFTFHFHALEKEMATHSSVLAWRIPGMAEPSGLPSMRSHGVGHDWSDLAAAAAASTIILTEVKTVRFHQCLFECVFNFCSRLQSRIQNCI